MQDLSELCDLPEPREPEDRKYSRSSACQADEQRRATQEVSAGESHTAAEHDGKYGGRIVQGHLLKAQAQGKEHGGRHILQAHMPAECVEQQVLELGGGAGGRIHVGLPGEEEREAERCQA